MGGDSWSPFIAPGDYDLSFPQLSFLAAVYGYVLFQASNLISDGSELLLFIPSMPVGVIGSVILPVLGAVPDGLMVLFSGIGAKQQLEKQIAVGVGTLAGSTIMLLTLPWCVAIFFGRVSINRDGTANYRRPKGVAMGKWQKLMPPGDMSLLNTGIRAGQELKMNAVLMMLTLTSYFIIQVPALSDDRPGISYDEQGEDERSWAFIAFVCSAAWFAVYLILQYREGVKDDAETINVDIEVENMIHLINEGKFTLMETMKRFQTEVTEHAGAARKAPAPDGDLGDALLEDSVQGMPKASLLRMKLLLKHFFERYDGDQDSQISCPEFHLVCRDMGVRGDVSVWNKLFQDTDVDQNGTINLKEFSSCIIDYARHKRDHAANDDDDEQPPLPNQRSISETHKMLTALSQDQAAQDQDDDEADDDDDAVEDLQDLEPEQRVRWIVIRSARMMICGTLILLFFASPMVDVLAAMGEKLNISAFYTSFVIAPIASNASELVAAYNYAKKRTERTITVSISTLQGAACMNNTFCLSIFMGLIYSRGMAWQFSAECFSIIVVEVILAFYSFFKRTQTLLDAIFICSLYPLSLVLVWFMKSPAMGFD